MKENSGSGANGKPAKPSDDFPLFPHATKRWAKKIKGQLRYFGPWSDPQGALEKYKREREDWEAGRTPTPAVTPGLPIAGEGSLVNKFLTAKISLRDSGEITSRTFGDYHATCARIVDAFGKTRLVESLKPEDFEKFRAELAKVLGPVALGNEIGRVRVVFKYASDNRLIPQPVAYGQAFKKPTRKVLRKERAAKGSRIFEADELRRIIDKAAIPLKAMVLLGINAGLGQSDIANLPLSVIDLDGGWLNYPRPKTGVDRRCALWPETVAALRDVLAVRPKATDKADSDLAFITSRGARWVRTSTRGDEENPKWTNQDAISQEFRKILKTLEINGHRGFYCLRRGFETIGGDSLDQVAVDHIMGHIREDMASVYRQRIEDARLKRVTDHVRGWLFPAEVVATAQ